MIVLRYLLAVLRLLLFAMVTSALIGWYVLRSLFVGRDLRYAFRLRSAWCRLMLVPLGIRIHREGKVHPAPAFYMCNHISYIDPAVVLKYVKDGRVIGKAEVASWPIIGLAGEVTGAIFLNREDARSRAAVRQAMVDEWQNGYSILNYPEGTTGGEPKTLPFKPGGFAAAAEYGIPVVPVALWFDNPDAAFLADDRFLPSFLKCFGAWKNHVRLVFGEAQTSRDGARIMNDSREWIDQSLRRITTEQTE